MSAPAETPVPKAPLAGPVKFYDWNRPQTAEAVEISTGGMFLKTAAPLAEDRLVTLRVQLTDGSRPFTVLGKVIRTVKGSLLRPGGMDIRFVDLLASDRASIETYVQRRTLKVAA